MFVRVRIIWVEGRKRETYQNADDGDQEGDFHQAVEDEEETANHLGGGLSMRQIENVWTRSDLI